MDNITLVIPSHNNLKHLKNCLQSIRTFYPTVKLVLLNDNSTDGTESFLRNIELQDPNVHTMTYKTRKGHTLLYDIGIKVAQTGFVGILHADMIVGPNFLENMLKYAKKGRMVCATRIEPPLHPPGREKIIENFGLDFNDLNTEGFWKRCGELQAMEQHKDKTTKGMFAPWIVAKEDFEEIGGHDSNFAPFPYEDSDLFQRMLMNGIELIQSRDSFVYHLTCRGHRWTERIQKDSDEFKKYEAKARHYYIKKWKSWIRNDENMHPIVPPVYTRSLIMEKDPPDLRMLDALHPWFDNMYMVGENSDKDDSDYQIVISDWRHVAIFMQTLPILNFRMKQAQDEGQLEKLPEFDDHGIKLVVRRELQDRAKELIHAPK